MNIYQIMIYVDICIFNDNLHFITKVILYFGRLFVWLLFCRKFVSYLHDRVFCTDVCMFTLLKKSLNKIVVS